MKTKILMIIFCLCSFYVDAQNTNLGTGAGNSGSHNTSLGYYAGDNVTGSWNTVIGSNAGKNLGGALYNTFIGYNAGLNTKDIFSSNNLFAGYESGLSNTSGAHNVFLGSGAGRSNISGSYNTAIGRSSKVGTAGNLNTFLGYFSGRNTDGERNVMIGAHSGGEATGGTFNTFLGAYTGYYAPGSNNIFIGYRAGYYESGSDKLYIENSSSSAPLIYGDFATDKVGINSLPINSHTLSVGGTIHASGFFVNGVPISGDQTFWTSSGGSEVFNLNHNFGIGTSNPTQKLDVKGIINASGFYIDGQPFLGGGSKWANSGSNISYNTDGVVSIGTTASPVGYKLAVAGKILAEEIVVKLQTKWPDYVFEKNYELMSLSQLKDFIGLHGHLPDVPTASEINENGISLGSMDSILLKKIEELTLYIIALEVKIEELKSLQNSTKDESKQ